MVELGRHIIFPLVYCLIELALILLVATTPFERVFSTNKIIKIELCNKMRWLNDLMMCQIEREFAHVVLSV